MQGIDGCREGEGGIDYVRDCCVVQRQSQKQSKLLLLSLQRQPEISQTDGFCGSERWIVHGCVIILLPPPTTNGWPWIFLAAASAAGVIPSLSTPCGAPKAKTTAQT